MMSNQQAQLSFWQVLEELQVYCGDIHAKKTSDQAKGPIGLMPVTDLRSKYQGKV